MTVRSRALFLPAPRTTGGGHTIYVQPAGRTAILRQLGVQITGSGTRLVEVAVSRPSVGAYVPFTNQPAQQAGAAVVVSGLYVVLEPADEVIAYSSGDQTAQLRVGGWGVLLSGVPT